MRCVAPALVSDAIAIILVLVLVLLYIYGYSSIEYVASIYSRSMIAACLLPAPPAPRGGE